jgi:hypothetical protein
MSTYNTADVFLHWHQQHLAVPKSISVRKSGDVFIATLHIRGECERYFASTAEQARSLAEQAQRRRSQNPSIQLGE